MSIVRKSLTGLTSALDSWKQTIQTWCNNTFATKQHTHTQNQITNFSAHSGINLAAGINYSSATTAANAVTMPDDGWIHVRVNRAATGQTEWYLYIGTGRLTMVGNDWNNDSILLPVKKGNKVYCAVSKNEGGSNAKAVWIYFYPLI